MTQMRRTEALCTEPHLLRCDHADLDAMMNRYGNAATTPEEQTELWADIVQLVFRHAFAEETVL